MLLISYNFRKMYRKNTLYVEKPVKQWFRWFGNELQDMKSLYFTYGKIYIKEIN